MGITVSCLMVVSSLAFVDAPADEALIRAILTARSEAWTEKDVPALVKDYADSADYVNSTGEHTAGKQAIEEQYRKLFASGRYDGVTSKQSIARINLVKPDVAVVDAAWSASGVKDADGNALPERKGRSTLVLIKENDTWKIVSVRASLLPGEATK